MKSIKENNWCILLVVIVFGAVTLNADNLARGVTTTEEVHTTSNAASTKTVTVLSVSPIKRGATLATDRVIVIEKQEPTEPETEKPVATHVPKPVAKPAPKPEASPTVKPETKPEPTVVEAEVEDPNPLQVTLDESGLSKENYYLAQLVQAEAGIESVRGRTAVANVVLNRVRSSNFPNTVSGVINQAGQFETVSNGTINCYPTPNTVKAVTSALGGAQVVSNKVLFFFNPDYCSQDNWLFTLEQECKIDHQIFAY